MIKKIFISCCLSLYISNMLGSQKECGPKLELMCVAKYNEHYKTFESMACNAIITITTAETELCATLTTNNKNNEEPFSYQLSPATIQNLLIEWGTSLNRSRGANLWRSIKYKEDIIFRCAKPSVSEFDFLTHLQHKYALEPKNINPLTISISTPHDLSPTSTSSESSDEVESSDEHLISQKKEEYPNGTSQESERDDYYNVQNKTLGQPLIIAIPGILGNSYDKGYSESILSLLQNNGCGNYTIIRTGTLSIEEKPDLGQTRCIKHLTNIIAKIVQQNPSSSFIIVAASQGTGTLTKLLAEQKDKTFFLNNIKAIIFEGYAASFNQCISHIAETQISPTYYLPFKHYWLPYVAKYIPYFEGTYFPLCHYNPAEKQPFENLEHLPSKIPIIIVHCKQDRLTPYQGALAAYHRLVSTGHKNTHLFLVEKHLDQLDPTNLDDGHIDLLAGNDRDDALYKEELVRIIKTAISENNDNKNPVQTITFHPKKKQYARYANTLETQNKIIRIFDKLLTATKLIFIFCILLKISTYIPL